MRLMRSVLMRAFGRPQGILGRLGGVIMARTNVDCGAWVTHLLEITPNDRVLEVGFGPGMVIQHLAKLAAAGHIAGIDQSREMVERLARGTQSPYGAVRSNSATVLWKTYPLMTTALTRRWRSTRCRSGRIP